MIYVYPVPAALRGRLIGLPRLYAHPSVPEPLDGSELVLMDSGAYALYQRGGRWSFASMRALSEHYLTHGASDRPPWVGIAPDVFLRPDLTMKNWERWQKDFGRPVAPVVQFTRKGRLSEIDFPAVAEQVACYRESAPGLVCVSNPGLRGREAQDARFRAVIQVVRETIPGVWVHVLGAGWSVPDIRDWVSVGADSIDSIAYYEEAKDGRSWLGNPADHWTKTALGNAYAAGLAACGGINETV